MRAWNRALWTFCIALGAVGCTESGSGFAWSVDLSGIDDECNEPDAVYEDTLEFLMDFEGSAATLALGPSVFATGTISGCTVTYQSVVWPDERDGHALRWRLEGSATWRPGGTACNLEEGVDWLGQETVTIVDSEHPDLEPGCRYTMQTEGIYLGEQ